MSAVVSLLVLIWLLGVGRSAGACPEGYGCKTERDTYVLTCKSFNDRLHLWPVLSTIEDVPIGVSHLKIKCRNHRVEVKLSFANLTNIQILTLEHLNISSCGKDMFRGITNISHLTMNKLTCKGFENDSFNGLKNLRSLTIEHFGELTHMHKDVLAPLVSLQSLSFRDVRSKTNVVTYEQYSRILGGISSKHFQSLQLYVVHSNSRQETLNITDLFRHGSVGYALKRLDIGQHNIVKIIGSPAKTLPMLERMSLSGTIAVASRGSRLPLQFWMEMLRHPRLETLNVTGLSGTVPKTNSDAGFRLTKDCSQSTNITLGARFRSMSFSNLNLVSDSATPLSRFCLIDQNRTLKYIDFSNFRSTSAITTSLPQLRALKHVDLRNVSLRGFAKDTFDNMTNLRVLLLGNNAIGNIVSNDTESRIFHKHYNLHNLDLSACQLTEIPYNEFSNLRQLQRLDVSGNKLQRFHVDLYAMKTLALLNLSNNTLRSLSANMRRALDEIAAVKVDISGNPLQCLCNNTDFVEWTHTTKVQFLNKSNTFCFDKNNAPVLLFNVDGEALMTECRSNTGWYLTVLLPLGIVFIGGLMLICAVYRYRAYCCSRIHVYKMSSDDKVDPVVYERDAFICYSSSDRAWVCNELLIRLADGHVSTIIHQRDFLPGSVLEDSIRESIDKCRYTVLILSPDFLSSNWCRLEMHLARGRSDSRGRDVIVPIILREFPMSKLSPTLVAILEKSYLKWGDNPEEQAQFWDKLITKLKRGGNIKPMET